MSRGYWLKRRLVFALLGITLLHSCRNYRGDTDVRERISLHRDFAYAQQTNFIKSREPAFRLQSISLRGKKFPAIFQEQPGELSFYLQLKKDPVLRLTTLFQKKSSSQVNASVTVQSERPNTRSWTIEVGENQPAEIRLKDFENQVVRLTLSARSQAVQRLGGFLYWIDPVLEQGESRQTAIPGIDAFRRRHAANNVLIFLFDATNPSHLGCYGYSRNTSPTIDRLAEEGVLWENAMTQAVSTLASTGSLLTGLYPDVHGVLVKPDALSKKFQTMAEYFQQSGYRTALFSGNPNASPAMGYGQGFQDVWNLRHGGPVMASEFVPLVTGWLDSVQGKNFFGYVHFREPHEPYTPPPDFIRKFSEVNFRVPSFEPFVRPDDQTLEKVITAYDANIAYVDSEFAKILRHLKETGLDNNTIVIVLSDHGEAFWEHGKQGHNFQVYEETGRIPFIVKFPGETKLKGIRRKEVTGSIDLLPTFIDLFPYARKGIVTSGRSLLPDLLKPEENMDRMILTQTSSQAVYGLRSRRFKYVFYGKQRSSTDEFYDLSSDPGETRNVLQEFPVTSSFMRAELLKQLEANRSAGRKLRGKGRQEKAVIDEQTEQELKALGYVN